MNWSKTLVAGVVGGIVMSVVSFLLHGVVLAGTYTRYDQVFRQDQASPAWFFLTSIVIAIVVAILFARTRACWPAGLSGGIQCALLAGLVVGFTNFFWPLVFDGFPYYLAWCWLGIDVIVYAILGVVLGFFLKPVAA